MEFKLEPYHRNVTDEELISDLLAVKTKLNREKITREDYNNHGKHSPITQNSVIKLENFSNEVFKFEIFDLLGTKIKEQNYINSNKIYLDKRDYTAGLYIFRLIDKNGKAISGKFIVK